MGLASQWPTFRPLLPLAWARGVPLDGEVLLPPGTAWQEAARLQRMATTANRRPRKCIVSSLGQPKGVWGCLKVNSALKEHMRRPSYGRAPCALRRPLARAPNPVC